MIVANILHDLRDDFFVSTVQLRSLAAQFASEMRAGLSGQPQSLAMLPSWLTHPTGREKGLSLSLDFGGTNVRAMMVELDGHGRYSIRSHRSVPLTAPSGEYDYSGPGVTGEELFRFIAALLGEVAPTDGQLPLGHTFSFPCRQTAVNEAYLLYWTKEISVSGMVGRNVTELLQGALAGSGLRHIRPVVVVNDTVTTLLIASYTDRHADIGSICGTGHNSCYLEPRHPASPFPMYVNIEAGNFDRLPFNRFDELLDRASDRPGAGRLEKMCSGRYMGELFRLTCQHLNIMGLDTSLLGGNLNAPYSLTSQDMSRWLNDSRTEAAPLQAAARLIAARSARLAAATWTAILSHIDPGLSKPHTIAIDGSLYEKLPGYAGSIRDTLTELLGDKADLVTCRLVKDGSGVGAAVAAATVWNNGQCEGGYGDA